jgi:hypothetical protein
VVDCTPASRGRWHSHPVPQDAARGVFFGLPAASRTRNPSSRADLPGEEMHGSDLDKLGPGKTRGTEPGILVSSGGSGE